MRPDNRIFRLLAAAALLAQAVPAVAGDDFGGDAWIGEFYRWNAPVPQRPGIMLRTETAPAEVSLPAAGRAERILYSSNDWRDSTPRTVSGIVFFPKGSPPPGGWPVLAWAHGTTGIADACAPSAIARSPRDAAFLGSWLGRGYAIVATDYAGLGTPGVHPYLEYRSEGMSVLDAIRAALARYPELDPAKVMTIGQSQGSEAAIAAAYLAPSYAPELSIKGTVATGIVAQTANAGNAPQMKLDEIYLDDANYANSAYEILWFLGTVRSADPAGIRPEDYLSSGGWAMLAKAQTGCMRDLVGFAGTQKVRFSQFYKRPIDDLEKVAATFSFFPDVHIASPVFTGTGLKDRDAMPGKQYNFISAMCAAGTAVEWHYYPGEDHGSTVAASLEQAPAFVEAAMSGRRIAGNCADLKQPAG